MAGRARPGNQALLLLWQCLLVTGVQTLGPPGRLRGPPHASSSGSDRERPCHLVSGAEGGRCCPEAPGAERAYTGAAGARRGGAGGARGHLASYGPPSTDDLPGVLFVSLKREGVATSAEFLGRMWAGIVALVGEVVQALALQLLGDEGDRGPAPRPSICANGPRASGTSGFGRPRPLWVLS